MDKHQETESVAMYTNCSQFIRPSAAVFHRNRNFRSDSLSNEKKDRSLSNKSSFNALVFSFFSGLSFSINGVIVRFARNVHPAQMGVYRFLGMMFFCLPIAVYRNENLLGPKGSRRLLFYRGISAIGSVFLSFMSFRYLPIGEASVIVFSTPVFVTIFARILLKEVCGLVQSVIVGITVLGIILIINPVKLTEKRDSFTTEHVIGLLAGLGGLFSQCAMVLLTRKTRNVHYSVVSVTSSVMGLAGCTAMTVILDEFSLPLCGTRRLFGLVMGVSSFVGQILYIQALQQDNIGPVVTVKAASDILIAIIWQTTLFAELPDAFGISGTFVVTFSVLLTGLRKWILTLPAESPTRKKLKLLTL